MKKSDDTEYYWYWIVQEFDKNIGGTGRYMLSEEDLDITTDFTKARRYYKKSDAVFRAADMETYYGNSWCAVVHPILSEEKNAEQTNLHTAATKLLSAWDSYGTPECLRGWIDILRDALNASPSQLNDTSNEDSIIETFNLVSKGKLHQVSFSWAPVVMISKEHYNTLVNRSF